MNLETVTIDRESVRKLLSSTSADGALLYIYLHSGNTPDSAEAALHMSHNRFSCAMATLRQLGLWNDDRPAHILAGERPCYSEEDVLSADRSFQSLCDEIQRVLGRAIHTEDRKIILGFVNYLGLPGEVISMLISYCKNQAQQKGKLRPPSLRTIEKEAYYWAEHGIDTVEEAAAFIQSRNVRNTRLHRLMNSLQIHGRALTAAEERYAGSWLEMGFDDDVIDMAYERTCLNTGGLNWPYMNKILQRWHEAGLHTAEAVRTGDRKPGAPAKGGQRQLDDDEQAAIARMLREG